MQKANKVESAGVIGHVRMELVSDVSATGCVNYPAGSPDDRRRGSLRNVVYYLHS